MTSIIENYLESECRKINSNNKEYCREFNSRPCEVCRNKIFVELYRKTAGEFEFDAYFRIFGGSAHASGEIDTEKVQSCAKCRNERIIKAYNYKLPRHLFWDIMYNFYYGIDRNRTYYFNKIPKIFLENPLDVWKYSIENSNWKYDFLNNISKWDTETWAHAGFAFKKKKMKFLFWEWEVWPNWGYLLENNQ